MARGHQKFQSQQKNAKKQADIKQSKGHDQKAAAALVYTCTVCRANESHAPHGHTLFSECPDHRHKCPTPKTLKQHFDSKPPESSMPPELVGVEV